MIILFRNLTNKEKINAINAMYDKAPILPIFADYKKPINDLVISSISISKMKEKEKVIMNSDNLSSKKEFNNEKMLLYSYRTGLFYNILNGLRGGDYKEMVIFDPKIPGDSCISFKNTPWESKSIEVENKFLKLYGNEFLSSNFLSRTEIYNSIKNPSSYLIIDEPDDIFIEFLSSLNERKVILFYRGQEINSIENIEMNKIENELSYSDASALIENELKIKEIDSDFIKDFIEKNKTSINKFMAINLNEGIVEEKTNESESHILYEKEFELTDTANSGFTADEEVEMREAA